MEQLINSNITHDWPNVTVDYHKPIELFIDSFGSFKYSDSLKILWVKEVEEISRFKNRALNNYKNYDILLTYDEELLEKCDNSYFMPFGSSWVWDYNLNQKKEFNVSHLTGLKNMTHGHSLRKKIHDRQNEIKIPKNFFISHHGGPQIFENNKILTNSKTPLFTSQFSICIENSKQKNLFTEKLIDCFVTKTIPIFWGCDNIGDFFNTKGMFIVNNDDDIINVCNNLNEDYYESVKDIIDENYDKCLPYCDLANNFKITLEKIIKNGNF